MLTNALFAVRQSIFVGYADKFHISLNEDVPKAGKPPDVLTVDELAEVLEDFDPVHNLDDKKLVHFLAGRRIPEDELVWMSAQSKSSNIPTPSILKRLTQSLAVGHKSKRKLGTGITDPTRSSQETVPNHLYYTSKKQNELYDTVKILGAKYKPQESPTGTFSSGRLLTMNSNGREKVRISQDSI